MHLAAFDNRPQIAFVRVSIITSVYREKARHPGKK